MPAGISYGLADPGDATLTEWSGSIFGTAGRFQDRLFLVKIICGPQYPKQPPEVKFVSKVNLPFVDSSGRVIVTQFPFLKGWTPAGTILQVLVEIQKAMKANSGLSQPPDGATY